MVCVSRLPYWYSIYSCLLWAPWDRSKDKSERRVFGLSLTWVSTSLSSVLPSIRVGAGSQDLSVFLSRRKPHVWNQTLGTRTEL